VLKDQLEIYKERKISWSIWLYKDIGFQGMVYVSPDTPYIKRLKPFLQKKASGGRRMGRQPVRRRAYLQTARRLVGEGGSWN